MDLHRWKFTTLTGLRTSELETLMKEIPTQFRPFNTPRTNKARMDYIGEARSKFRNYTFENKGRSDRAPVTRGNLCATDCNEVLREMPRPQMI